MSIINQKLKIFGEISAKRTMVGGLPKLKVNPSFPSINNDTNSLNFLTDLLSSLVGLESLKEVVIDTLTANLPNIEQDIKKVLKSELNSITSCQINPSIPTNLRYDGSGVDLELKKIDFSNMLLTNPTSEIGELLYSDVPSKLNSKDFNTFLYYVIQSGKTHTWANCLDITFIEEGETNNVINIKVNKSFIDSGKSLKDLNNTLVDSVSLFDLSEILNKLLDNVFGVISTEQNKSKNQILNELKINNIIDSIINQEDDEVIDDSFFKFDNDELVDLEMRADNKKRGVKVVVTSTNYDISTNLQTLSNITKDVKSSDNKDLNSVLNNAIDKIGLDITKNIPEIDKYSVKLDFIGELVKNLMRVIGSVIISPKVITILALNHQIVYGVKFDDSIDFIMKNKYFIKNIFNGVRDVVIERLLNKVLKEIETLVLETTAEIMTEQIKNTSAIINSLVGIPLEVTRQISGITKKI